LGDRGHWNQRMPPVIKENNTLPYLFILLSFAGSYHCGSYQVACLFFL